MKKTLTAAFVFFLLCTASFAAVRKVGEFGVTFIVPEQNKGEPATIEISVSDDGRIVFSDDEHGMETSVKRTQKEQLIELLQKQKKVMFTTKDRESKNIGSIGETSWGKFTGIEIAVWKGFEGNGKGAAYIWKFFSDGTQFTYGSINMLDGWSIAEILNSIDGPQQTPPPSPVTPPPAPPSSPQNEAPKLPQLSGHRPLTKSTASYGYVTARGLNIRADHNTQSRIVAQARQGASLSIIESWYDNENGYSWYKIDDLKEWGWVSGKFVATAHAPLIGTVTVKSGKLNVRTDHSKTAASVGTAEKGQRFVVDKAWASSDVPYPWFHIVANNGDGWVSGRYFVIDGHQPNNGWRLSDEEYNEFLNNPDFAAADAQMIDTWQELRQEVGQIGIEEYQKGQNAWYSKRRDRVATNIYNKQGGSKRECYRLATLERVKELRGAIKKEQKANY